MSETLYQLNSIKTHADEVQKKFDELKAENLRLSLNLPPKVLFPYKARDFISKKSEKITQKSLYGHNKEIDGVLYQRYIDDLLAILEEDKLTKLENDKIIKHNKDCLKNAIAYMTNLGLQENEYVNISKRSYKTEKRQSAWLTSINKMIVTHDGGWQYSGYNSTIADIVKQEQEAYKKYMEDKEKVILQEKAAKEIDIKAKQKLEFFATLKVKYKFDCNLDYSELLSNLIKKNKYLSLAHYLQLNRSDWSDGCNYAKSGLSIFAKLMDGKSQLDNDIYSEISSYCHDWDNDGRIFRDCQNNYSVLFSMVGKENKELYQDYLKLEEYTERY